MPEIIKTTPRIPIRLPTNSIVDSTPTEIGAMASAMNAPKIAFEVIMKNEIEIYMKFMLTLVQVFLLLLGVHQLTVVLN